MLGDYEPSAEHYTEVEDRICASGKRNATRPFETASRLFSGMRTGASLSGGGEFRIVGSESATRGMNRRLYYFREVFGRLVERSPKRGDWIPFRNEFMGYVPGVAGLANRP